jgi:hypothetical protein
MALNLLSSNQTNTPVYNPMVYVFSGSNFTQTGYRYVVDIYSASTSTKLGSFRIAPQIDGSGYIDLSKILSNFVSVDFNPTITGGTKASNSYVSFDFKLGEEYNTTWTYNYYEYFSSTASTLNELVRLRQFASATTHTFVVGDQINVTSTNNVNGLWTVVHVPDPYAVVINMEYFDVTPTGTIGGSIVYADNRKTLYSGLTGTNGKVAFNGALPFKDFMSYSATSYGILQSSPSTTKALTNQPTTFYATPDQNIWFNYMKGSSDGVASNMRFRNSNGDVLQLSQWWNNVQNGSINQVPVGPNNASPIQVYSGSLPLIKDDTEWYEWYTVPTSSSATSQTYRVYIDRRCKIEDFEIAFMDRMGTVSSFAFQLRATENTTGTREQYKEQVGSVVSNNWNYNSHDRGTTNSSISISKTYTLNTNWMTQAMNVYFEELVFSPYTWVKIDGQYYACTIDTNSVGTERESSRKLIRKTIDIKLSNENAINI